jgi:hypothetical protein
MMKTAFSTMSIPAAAAAALLLLPITVSAEQPYCGFTAGPCISGCWNADQVIHFNLLRYCEPVGKGFYSPMSNDARIMCQAGTYSNSSDQETAGICDECPKGTYSSKGAPECTPCPVDSYNGFSGSDSCTECNGEFSGSGSNDIRLVPMQDGTFETFCVGGEPVVPTASPTVSTPTSISPSDMPSMIPSMHPMQGKTESSLESIPFQRNTPPHLKELQNLTHYPFCIIL